MAHFFYKYEFTPLYGHNSHKAWLEDEMKRNGYQTDFVFTTSAGQMYHQSSIRKAMKRFYADRGLPNKKCYNITKESVSLRKEDLLYEIYKASCIKAR